MLIITQTKWRPLIAERERVRNGFGDAQVQTRLDNRDFCVLIDASEAI
jgi:hypothetical protein